MSYSRPPNVIVAGQGLVQTPSQSTVTPAGVVPVTVDANIATTSSLGIIQIGSGLSVSPAGILSTIGNSSLLNVYLTGVNYTANNTNFFIGTTEDDVIITLPLGVTGKVFIIKNQARGSIRVRGSSGQTLDGSTTKTLGTNSSLMALFDGTEWALI